MAFDEETAIILWPEYFDSTLTRAQGRRLPVSLCVKNPDLDMIAKGAIMLDLDYAVHEEMCYPADWASKKGCIKVEKGKMKKTAILPAIGKILVDNQR